MRPAGLIVLTLSGAAARRFHDENYHKHAHTYLQFCANSTSVVSHACVHKVSARWPTPAQLDPQECKEASAPFLSGKAPFLKRPFLSFASTPPQSPA